jgi:cell division inhibitor SulA/protein ImuA
MARDFMFQQSKTASRIDAEQLEQLRTRIQDYCSRNSTLAHTFISSGYVELDAILPGGGFLPGQLVEWLGEGHGSGAGMLALHAAWQVASPGGILVALDRDQLFFPPAASALGINLDNLVLVRAGSAREEFWALDQVLRSAEVAAVWVSLDHCDDRHFRRLQLSVEQGGTLGCLVRSARVLGQPSWAHLQLLVKPVCLRGPAPADNTRQRQLEITVIRCQGPQQGRRVVIDFPQ